MEALFESLAKIKELLEQIYTITHNQMTVLIDHKSDHSELDMIEEMASYKQELTLEVETVEKVFQEQYTMWKTYAIEQNLMKNVQTKVGYILKLREDIVSGEQKNVLLLEDAMRRCVERVEFPKDPGKVANAYKQHKRLT